MNESDTSDTPFEDESTIANPIENIESVLNDTPSQIGPYKILAKLGEGGFGVVYEAQQEKPVRRRVALKVIKPGMDSKKVIARFEAERQALALMTHPNIAKVLGGGLADRGLPYFVMELVKGEPITEFCDRNKMPLNDRLKLLIPVCHAIQHAHAKAVIHRDLKPSNILVGYDTEGHPMPTVIDFGVAKALNQQLTEKTIYTQEGQMIGTPEYMSPEQAEMSGVDIDTRTDVYSLGVVLYELLTGMVPFGASDLRSKAYAEMQRIIREEDPPRPSTKLNAALSSEGTHEQVVTAAKRRHMSEAELSKHLRGELDWVVMKCLDKDRDRRYATPAALAEELGHYLADEPVEARPPSAGYRLGKFVRRNKGPVAVGMIFLLLFSLGSVGTTWGYIHSKRLRMIADKSNKQLSATLAEQRILNYRLQLYVLVNDSWDLPEDELHAGLLEIISEYNSLPDNDPFEASYLQFLLFEIFVDGDKVWKAHQIIPDTEIIFPALERNSLEYTQQGGLTQFRDLTNPIQMLLVDNPPKRTHFINYYKAIGSTSEVTRHYKESILDLNERLSRTSNLDIVDFEHVRAVQWLARKNELGLLQSLDREIARIIESQGFPSGFMTNRRTQLIYSLIAAFSENKIESNLSRLVPEANLDFSNTKSKVKYFNLSKAERLASSYFILNGSAGTRDDVFDWYQENGQLSTRHRVLLNLWRNNSQAALAGAYSITNTNNNELSIKDSVKLSEAYLVAKAVYEYELYQDASRLFVAILNDSRLDSFDEYELNGLFNKLIVSQVKMHDLESANSTALLYAGSLKNQNNPEGQEMLKLMEWLVDSNQD